MTKHSRIQQKRTENSSQPQKIIHPPKMLATEYHRTGTTTGGTSSSTSKYSCSAVSSETLSGSCGSRNNRVRTVRLVRRHAGAGGTLSRAHHHQPPLGFSIRGGHEHGTGVFVSHVEPGSEADQQGLRVGDQIIRINGFTIEDAVHKEVLQLISNHTHLTLKVRGVGMIPVKEQKNDSLSWQIISPSTSSSRSSPQFGEKTRDVRINIFVAPRSKLGCGICKGPDWKPGIFVQFTKEGGIAREAGLRPGDQIVQCNGVDFSDVPFNEAVNLMKTSRQLDLVIRKSAASELFPGESSGYNSSASSVTEDQNPAWSDPKRLSIVKEENHDLEDRLAHERLNKRISSNSIKWELDEWNEETESQYYKKTIINLSDTGSTIKSSAEECRPSESNSTKKELEKDNQTVVEVHRSEIDDEIENNHSKLKKSASVSSFASVTSKSSITSATSSLSSAISMEIQRRIQKQASKQANDSIDEQLQVKKMLKNVTFDQQHQHNKLMNEFKQVHQKMFKPNENDAGKQNEVIGKDTMYRLAHKDLSKKLSNKLFDLVNAEDASSEGSKKIGATASPPPPPPPPPSSKSSDQEPSNTSTLKPSKTKPKAPPVPPVKHSTLSFQQPPPCPTPDYDTLSIASSTSTILKKDQDAVEMESLDSFRMSAPTSVHPKPPSTYFQKRDMVVGGEEGQYGTIKGHKPVEKSKSVSVIIGEYQANTQPGKLNFLRRGPDTFKPDGSRTGLADELRHTLNRSNLRKRTESMDDLLSTTQQIKPQSNGTVRISLKSNLSKEFTKSTSDLTEDFETSFKPKNKITINVNNEKKFDGSSNGIFKSNYG